MRFYLGTHLPSWLRTTEVPLFVSHRRLASYRSLPVAADRWALDSGGFTELSMFGEWRTSPEVYATAVRRYSEEVGRLDFAAPQDWMCEPHIIKKTGRSVGEHQRLTVDNFLRLRDLAPNLPIMPVLQGWSLDDYWRCVDLYQSSGVDLVGLPRVGLGSICRRNRDSEINDLVVALAGAGMHLHGFGVKASGLQRFGEQLSSADSMAWSFTARRESPLDGCSGHINCANCQRYALRWYDRLYAGMGYTDW